MKKEIKITERHCDKCGHVSQADHNNPLIGGGGAFRDWYSVSREEHAFVRSYRDRDVESAGPWDFCTKECMLQFFGVKKSVVKKKTATEPTRKRKTPKIR